MDNFSHFESGMFLSPGRWKVHQFKFSKVLDFYQIYTLWSVTLTEIVHAIFPPIYMGQTDGQTRCKYSSWAACCFFFIKFHDWLRNVRGVRTSVPSNGERVLKHRKQERVNMQRRKLFSNYLKIPNITLKIFRGSHFVLSLPRPVNANQFFDNPFSQLFYHV